MLTIIINSSKKITSDSEHKMFEEFFSVYLKALKNVAKYKKIILYMQFSYRLTKNPSNFICLLKN